MRISCVLFLIGINLTSVYSQIMCSDDLGSFDYNSIVDHTIPFPFYVDVSSGIPVIPFYFRLSNSPGGCGLGTAPATWTLTELNPADGSVIGSPPGNVTLSATSGANINVQGTPDPTTSPYRFEIKMTVGGTDYLQQFIIYVTRPMNVSLVLDISGSMGSQADPSIPGVTRLDVLKAATGKFLDYFKFFSNPTGILVPDSVGVVYFTGSATLFPSTGQLVNSFLDCSDPTKICVDDIKADITTKTPQNSTGMGKGVIEALKQQTHTNHSPIRNIVLFTDGIQNTPLPKITGTATTVSFEPGAPATDYLSDLPANTDIGIVANYDDIKISTIGLAVSGAYFTNLQNIADATGGYKNSVPITKTTDLDDSFLFNLTQIMRGGSPQIVDIARGNLASGAATEEFTLNKTISSLVFDITALTNPNISFTIEKDGVDVTALGKTKPGNLYKSFYFSFSTKSSGPNITPEGQWTVKLTGQQAEAYKVIAVADDHAINFNSTITSGKKVNEPIEFKTDVTLYRGPLKNATVKALILKPGQDLGTLLATKEVKRESDVVGSSDLSAGNIKLQQLLQDPSVYQSLIPQEQVVSLTSNNDGSYSGKFLQTDVTGLYQVIFSLEGDGPSTGKYFRMDMQSIVLQIDDIELENSSPQITRTKNALKISIRPRSASNLYLGPDFSSIIKLTSSIGTLGQVVDQLDGTYTVDITGVAENEEPVISLEIFDQTVYSGEASGIAGASWWGKYWWIFLVIALLIFLIWKFKK